MRKNICRQIICLALAMILIVGMLPGMTFVAYAETPITNIEVTGITPPVVGETPDYTATVSADASYYIGDDIVGMTNDVNGISWVNNGTSPIRQDTTFAEDGSYDVRMEIYAKDGASFVAKENLNVKVNGQPAHVISGSENMIYIRYTFGAPVKKQIITSIELYHDSDIEAKSGTKNLQVSKINGEAFDGEKYVSHQWYRSDSNFSDINESGVSAWDDAADGYKFVGGYAYGLRIHSLPEIDGYVYGPTVVVSLKTPSDSKLTTTDGNGNCYFYFDKLAYKPDLESVDITMDGYYVDANVMNLTFSSKEPIKTDGGYGVNFGRYTIRKYNSGTGQYDVLSSTPFVAGQKYYLFFYLESDSDDIEGLERENIRVNEITAFQKGKENGRTYYTFSLPTLTEADVEKTKISSVVLNMPKAKPAAGGAVYYPTVVSANGDTNLANAVSVNNRQWYQCDYHTKEAYYRPLEGDKFVQGLSYRFWLQVTCGQGYEFTDDCAVIVQTPSENLKGELEYKNSTSIEYDYYYNLGAPTELPGLTSYEGTLSGYDAGKQVQNTQMEIKVNGKKIPEDIRYGTVYAILDKNQQFIEEGTLEYDTQYYCAMILAPYNCKMDNVTESTIKEVATLNGMKPEGVTKQMGTFMAIFKLPKLYKNLATPKITISNVASSGAIKLSWDTVSNATKYEIQRSVGNDDNYVAYKTTTNTSFTNTAVTAGKTYYYRVKAVGAGGESDWAYEYQTCDLARPEISISNVASSGAIKLSWNAVSGADRYEIQRSVGNDDNYVAYKTTTSTSFTNTATTAGKTYYYRVRSIYDGKSSANSAWAYEYQTCDLARPEISISNVASSGKIKLSWKAVEGADGYEIQRSVGNDDNYVAYKTTTSTSFTNTATTAGTTYYYRVRAIYDGKSSANSAWGYEYQTCDLAAPEITVSGTKKPGKIVVSWSKVSGADRYYIYRATSKNGTYSKYDTTTSTTYTNSSVTEGKTYYYKVIAVYDGKSTANSAYSNMDYAWVR